MKRTAYTCIKCDGKGHLSYHLNVANGLCFACNGSGKTHALVAVRPEFDGATLYIGDGTSWGLSVYHLRQASRADQLENIARDIRGADYVNRMATIAMRIAILGCPRAAARARTYFDGAEFDGLVQAYEAALANPRRRVAA
jgi:hypothetical protein